MVAFKRKFDEIEDSDSEEPTFGRQILPVADLPDNFDAEPQDGLQYLFTVRRDARTLPQFTRVINPYETATETPPQQPSFQDPHPGLPSAEWRTLTESRWKNIRKNFNQPTIATYHPISQRPLMPEKGERDRWWDFLSGKPESVWNIPPLKKKGKAKLRHQHCENFVQGKMRAWGNEEQPSGDLEENEGRDLDPDVKDQGSVRSGPETPDGATAKDGTKDSSSDQIPNFLSTFLETAVSSSSAVPVAENNLPATAPEIVSEKEPPTPREPSPKLLKHIDERMALHLLMYFTHWINLFLRSPDSPTYRPTASHARWIFVLLLRIDDYISPDDMNLLRNLARACLALIKHLVSKPMTSLPCSDSSATGAGTGEQFMSEQACWIIISAIVSVWSQHDLWTDAGTILTGIEPTAFNR